MSILWQAGNRCQVRVGTRWERALVRSVSEDGCGSVTVSLDADRSLHSVSPSVLRSFVGAGRSELNIFDFDGTLFRSATPSRSVWTPDAIDVLQRSRSRGGVGWFEFPDALEDPYVPAASTMDHFNVTVVEAARLSDARGCVTVFLTGRGPLTEARVRALLDTAGLRFHEHHFKAPQPGSTRDYKIAALRDLLARHPHVRAVTVWEDQAHIATALRDELAAQRAAGRLNRVDVLRIVGGSSELDPESDRRLVETLISRVATPPAVIAIERRADRTVLRVSATSRDELRALVAPHVPSGWVGALDATVLDAVLAPGAHFPPQGEGAAISLAVRSIGIGRRAIVIQLDNHKSADGEEGQNGISIQAWRPWAGRQLPSLLAAHSPIADPETAAKRVDRWIETDKVVHVSGSVVVVERHFIVRSSRS